VAVLLICEDESDGNCNQNEEALFAMKQKEPFGFKCSSLFKRQARGYKDYLLLDDVHRCSHAKKNSCHPSYSSKKNKIIVIIEQIHSC
jgi:hypothetical protein